MMPLDLSGAASELDPSVRAEPPLVFMFPGQSSRYPGMLDRLVELHRPNADLLAWASDLLGRDLGAQYHADAGENAFARNVDVQVGVFLANHMFMATLDAAGIEAELSLGLSLGEWNHLVHIGAVSFADGLRAVDHRGRCYDEGPRGWMAAIQPISDEDLAAVVSSAAKLGVLEVVNLNSPQQHVVAGERAAVEAAVEHAEDEFYAQPQIIERNVPMHSSLFRVVGERFREHLEQLEFAAPRLPYLPNRLGELLDNPSRAQLIDLLSTHVHEPVLWRRSLDHIVAQHPDAVFVEVGPMSVLHNLMHRKWLRNRKFRTDSREQLADHFASVVAKLGVDERKGPRACTPS
ncbi:Malonyl CoA-acyl carrier protein transacylase [Enhygromyxa salina]|uniref:[acyl-carrier-protein] S-malonyltransferase n=1 Tax=Enhygromyxa salina TaxID=215803 RepID=A0A0C2D5U4_9BACT|nr:ACP S-malonyltransferase [Enhygromyxa salina]KIG15417.1 Malonyl CoA-acyl carrier protein transacylase [Enhygromyxa salina]